MVKMHKQCYKFVTIVNGLIPLILVSSKKIYKKISCNLCKKNILMFLTN